MNSCSRLRSPTEARIAKLLRATAESWLRMQAAVDLWELEQRPERLATVQPIDKRLLHARRGRGRLAAPRPPGRTKGQGRRSSLGLRSWI